MARHASRNTFAWLGMLLLVWTVLLSGVDPVRSDMTPDEFSFIILGLVEVFAGVMVLKPCAIDSRVFWAVTFVHETHGADSFGRSSPSFSQSSENCSSYGNVFHNRFFSSSLERLYRAV